MIVMHEEQMHGLIAGAAIIGAKTAAMMMGAREDVMLQKEAYSRYGNRAVKRWHKAGLLHPKRVDGCIYFPAVELMIASQTELVNRLTPSADAEIADFMLNLAKQGQ
jgi:hypothetical protein